jgi:hypothetical protein
MFSNFARFSLGKFKIELILVKWEKIELKFERWLKGSTYVYIVDVTLLPSGK